MGGEIFFDSGLMPEDKRAVPDGPLTDPEFDCCRRLADIAEGSLGAAERLACIASALAGERASLEEGTRWLHEERAALAGDDERLSRANKKINAENNGIKRTKTVPGTDRTGSGQPGRRAGCKPTTLLRFGT